MSHTRPNTLRAGLAAALVLPWFRAAAKADESLQKIRFGTATKVLSPIIINMLIPEYLGYYRAEGLTVETIPLGSLSAAYTALVSGRLEFSLDIAASQLELVAKGEKL